VGVDEDSQEDVNPDPLEAIRQRTMKEVGTVQPYHMKFSPDYIGQGSGVGVYYASGFGLQLINQIALSDLLGDNHILISFNIFHSIEDSDFLVSYYYLRKRIDYAVGLFQFKNYLNSRVSSLGEVFVDYLLFTERNYGAYALASYPFSTFTRLDAEFEGYISERQFFEPTNVDAYGYYYYASRKSERRLLQPTLSLVHDSAYFGLFGPVIGSRWMVSASRTISFSGTDVSRTTVFLDYRKYLPLYYRNYVAFRAIGASSTGNDPRFFFLGGPLTMRGYDYLQFSGSKIMLFNAEYRYPLVDALIFGWPGRWGIGDIGGTLFFDSGAVWGPGTYIEPLPDGIRPRVLHLSNEYLQFYSDFGVGFYVRFGYFILNFQLGWPTDFSLTGKSVFHFYIGPQF
jgi:outer membrane protein assembly factor BamA